MLLLENLDENVKKTSTLTLEEVVSKKLGKIASFIAYLATILKSKAVILIST